MAGLGPQGWENVGEVRVEVDSVLVGVAGSRHKFLWVCYGCPPCPTSVQIQGKGPGCKEVTSL